MMDSATVSLVLVGGVALLSSILAVLAYRARTASGKAQLNWVTAAFVLFCVKSIITFYALYVNPSQEHLDHPSSFPLTHGALEVLNSAFDLAIVACLVAPFLPFARRST